MPLSNTFLIATNTSLTTEFSGFEDLTHKTNQSDNPQDASVLYLGSLDSTKKLQTQVSPGVNNITLTPTDILPIWVASHAYTTGQAIQATATISVPGVRYECTTAGTTGSSEPSWNTSLGSTTTSGSAVFTARAAKHDISEVILALSSGDLATNTAGAALSLGNTILGGTSNKVAIYLRVNNAVTTVSSNTAHPEIAIFINALDELDV